MFFDKQTDVMVLSPELIKWELDVFFALKRLGSLLYAIININRPINEASAIFFSPQGFLPQLHLHRDLENLGLGPFLCPDSLTSGLHATLMSTQLCTQVSLFGLSYHLGMFKGPYIGHYNDRSETLYGFFILKNRLKKNFSVTIRGFKCTTMLKKMNHK